MLFSEHYPRLVLYTERFNLTRAESEDIVAEAFARLWPIRQNFEVNAQIKSFLYTTCRNAALNLLRDRRRHKTVSVDIEIENESAQDLEIIRAELIGNIYQEIQLLPERCREVVLLTYRDGLSTQQIAERMQISVSNVTSQRFRAISLLRIALAEKYPALLGLGLSEVLFSILSHA